MFDLQIDKIMVLHTKIKLFYAISHKRNKVVLTCNVVSRSLISSLNPVSQVFFMVNSLKKKYSELNLSPSLSK